MLRVFTDSPEDWSSIPRQVILKTQKMVLDAFQLNTQHYKVRVKGEVEQSRERSNALPNNLVNSYWKGSLKVTLNYGGQLISIYIYIYIYIYILKGVFMFLLLCIQFFVTKVREMNLMFYILSVHFPISQ